MAVSLSRVEKYRRMFLGLFPRGEAWEARDRDDSELSLLSKGVAYELARVEERGIDLKREADPNKTLELLPQWEALCGLPDECTGEAPTLADRRNQVLQKLRNRGGATQNESFFEALALNLGFVVNVETFRPFLAGKSVAGDALTNDPWKFWFGVSTEDFLVQYFLAGQGTAGQALQIVGNDTLECTIVKYKPAHTEVLFSFGA